MEMRTNSAPGRGYFTSLPPVLDHAFDSLTEIDARLPSQALPSEMSVKANVIDFSGALLLKNGVDFHTDCCSHCPKHLEVRSLAAGSQVKNSASRKTERAQVRIHDVIHIGIVPRFGAVAEDSRRNPGQELIRENGDHASLAGGILAGPKHVRVSKNNRSQKAVALKRGKIELRGIFAHPIVGAGVNGMSFFDRQAFGFTVDGPAGRTVNDQRPGDDFRSDAKKHDRRENIASQIGEGVFGRAAHIHLRGVMADHFRTEIAKKREQLPVVAQVELKKGNTAREILAVSRHQIIDAGHVVALASISLRHMRTNEPRRPGDQDSHASPLRRKKQPMRERAFYAIRDAVQEHFGDGLDTGSKHS